MLQKKTVKELKVMAKGKIKGFSKMKKAELINALSKKSNQKTIRIIKTPKKAVEPKPPKKEKKKIRIIKPPKKAVVFKTKFNFNNEVKKFINSPEMKNLYNNSTLRENDFKPQSKFYIAQNFNSKIPNEEDFKRYMKETLNQIDKRLSSNIYSYVKQQLEAKEIYNKMFNSDKYSDTDITEYKGNKLIVTRKNLDKLIIDEKKERDKVKQVDIDNKNLQSAVLKVINKYKDKFGYKRDTLKKSYEMEKNHLLDERKTKKIFKDYDNNIRLYPKRIKELENIYKEELQYKQ